MFDYILFDPSAWESDRSTRYHLPVLNQAFHDAVPVLAESEWRISHVERGFAETVMPLNIASTNQFVAHQAAMMLVAADYAGGVALSTLFHMVPILGFHPLSGDDSAYLWGARSSCKWILPSTDDLVCRASIDTKVWSRAYRRFKQGKYVLESAHIDMFNGATKVAEADFTYWVADTRVLRSQANDMQRVHPLQTHRLRSSAHLIAGLRAIEDEKSVHERLFHDPYAKTCAEKQGIMLAKRFSIRSPELQPMVAARTKNLDDLVMGFEARGIAYQMINVGAGLDFRRWRLPVSRCHLYIELDLPSLLQEKKILLDQLVGNDLSQRKVVQHDLDLLRDDVFSCLCAISDFDHSIPTLIWWEGGSMYFTADRCREILRSILKCLDHLDSRFWFDFVLTDLIVGKTEIPSVISFTESMQRMGEPFINGFDHIADILEPLGGTVCSLTNSGAMTERKEPVFNLYRFCVVSRNPNGKKNRG